MDGWIGLSGCGKWMEEWMWIEWMWMWKVESGAVPDLTPFYAIRQKSYRIQ